ncbi:MULTISPECIES: DUF3515 domain-containing protein [Mycobacterium]|uniref:DUF3515 domain-containing protein n=1 Tax=Mycobacterium kiyosense TaxID=2871094 RepID=A0A9P3QAA4_9MYCO|nr:MULTISPECIES: DUF3515 domain-containing protein [Mycobacterium]BDE13183.1 hypothetical protein MKCMC460_20430 [Mycobacterium sp. 20KCMC460]GLB81711.1 hypothetical protein SRL2020028_09670 [Mycobacterium kiyosense]GLC12952.1 hypothetical protein SRL2020448_15550 [Mycobacterium kiyosense]GLC22110.1 hypothetical protein SRL2020472_46810 [Mycobacterium kiyosense]GLD04727.1 hypothetical protein Mkiyose1383_10530 [Mycobacterium kiyosense]
MTGESDPGGPPRAVLIAALAVALVTIAGVLVFAATRDNPQRPVAIASVPAPQAANAECRALSAALPARLGDFQRAAVAQPAPEGASAWRAGSDTVIVRCGLQRPDDFVIGSPIQVVDRVQWFRVSGQSDDRSSTWYTVDRPVYVAITLPAESGPTPIQDLSAIIDRAIAATPIDPAPVR